LQYEPHSKIYNCWMCDSDQKKEYGCTRNKRKPTVRINCTCGGLNEKCEICKGKGVFQVKRCPASTIKKPDINALLPFFFFWRETKRYPDDGAMIKQPRKLVEAFELMSYVSNKREKEITDKELKNRK